MFISPFFTLLARIQLVSLLAALPMPFVWYSVLGKQVENSLFRYGIGAGLLLILLIGLLFKIGELFHRLKVQDGRLVFHRFWGDKSVALSECKNVQYAFDSLSSSRNATPKFYLLLTRSVDGTDKVEYWNLGVSWKISVMESFVQKLRRLCGLPAEPAQAQLESAWMKALKKDF